MRNNRHHRHSGGECESQGEDYGFFFMTVSRFNDKPAVTGKRYP
jgi:hypothetical protein